MNGVLDQIGKSRLVAVVKIEQVAAAVPLVSRLAAETAIAQGLTIRIALLLGPGSYMGRRVLLLRAGCDHLMDNMRVDWVCVIVSHFHEVLRLATEVAPGWRYAPDVRLRGQDDVCASAGVGVLSLKRDNWRSHPGATSVASLGAIAKL